ncbi:extracellular solute-binding protein [Thiorhodococcus minor]|uniref:extracellular solute-binding protein n=1 Tax=Thiorhodococcus minor TaxID=57489 RepID=UPI0031590A43
MLTRDTAAIAGPAARHARSFAAKTGIPVEVARTPFAELYERIMLGFVTAQMADDVLLIPSAWLPDFAPYLAPVPEPILEGRVVQDIDPVYRDALMRWRGQPMALTIDGDLHLGAYRRDLFEDPDIRAAFAAARGRALELPKTWAEYQEIAAFFAGREIAGERRLAGTLEAYARGGQRIWYLFSHAAAYTNHPAHPGAMFFDPDSMRPAIDNPGWVRALREFLALRKAGPGDVETLDSATVRKRFAAGDAAMDIDWADTGVLAGALRGVSGAVSPVAGHVGFFRLPGSDEVWNPATLRWDKLPAPRSVTFLAFGGWIGVVPASSRRIDQAWDYLAWLASPEHSAEDVLDGTSGINPYRSSHLEDAEPWRRLLGERQADDYLRVLRESLGAKTVARDLRLPGYRAYIAALEDQLDRVMAGEQTAEAGLKAAAEDWEALTDRLGRETQRRHYRLAMGLPVVE